MESRAHIHEETFDVFPEHLFALLHTPSAIREWWSAARAIVIPMEGGLWVAAWGADEDAPDYVTASRISTFRPPHRLVMEEYRYWAKSGPLPFEAHFVTAFDVTAHPEGAVLRVTQDGFPAGPAGDDFYAACEVGWQETFNGIRRYCEAHLQAGAAGT